MTGTPAISKGQGRAALDEILARLVDAAAPLRGMSDTVLHLRGLVREPICEAYGIAKSLAKTNLKLKSLLAPVIDFYAAIARAAAAARKANEAASLAEKAGGSGAKG